jgi:hypothetical protein
MADKEKKVAEKTKRRTGSTKIWKVCSSDSPEIFWVRGRTRAEVKKHLRHFFRSDSYWEGEPQEDLARDIFKSYCESGNLIDCPGLRVDDTRGDVLYSLTDPSKDWIDRDVSEGDKKKEEKVIQNHQYP